MSISKENQDISDILDKKIDKILSEFEEFEFENKKQTKTSKTLKKTPPINSTFKKFKNHSSLTITGGNTDDFYIYLIEKTSKFISDAGNEKESKEREWVRDTLMLIYQTLSDKNKLEIVFNNPEEHISSMNLIDSSRTNKRMLKIFYNEIIKFKRISRTPKKSIRK
jgi:hypothetical protein